MALRELRILNLGLRIGEKMKILSKIFFVMIMIFMMTSQAYAAGEKILYIPIDDRPVNLSQAVDILESAGYQMIVPPKNYFNTYDGESVDKLWAWIEENVSSADMAVISADAVLYGGLIPSRKHELPKKILNERVNHFKTLRQKNPDLKIYILSSIMRTPYEGTKGSNEEPDYYAQYGSDIYKYSALADKEKVEGLTNSELETMHNLKKNVPDKVFNDWISRRKKNLDVTKKIIDMTDEGIISYLIIGLDDHLTFSQTKSESRELSSYVQTKHIPQNKLQILSGMDEFGLVLMTRAINDLRDDNPKVFVKYNKGMGGNTIPAYSEEKVRVSVYNELELLRSQIVAQPKDADLILLVNTDPEGRTYHTYNSSPFTRDKNFNAYIPRDGTKYFADMVEGYVNQGYRVGVADITFGNGADNPMMNLLNERGLLFKLQSYAGWNTATNSIGYALATGILTKDMSQENKNKILATRYLDDWGYQANVRTTVGDWIFYNFPNGATIYGNLGENKSEIEERITNLMHEFAEKNLPHYDFLRDLKVTCPWNRMFEVDIEFNE